MADWRNSPVARDYAVDELMVTVLADQFRNGDQTTNGMASFIPVAAFMLARLTHAPELIWLASSGGLEPRPDRIPASQCRGFGTNSSLACSTRERFSSMMLVS